MIDYLDQGAIGMSEPRPHYCQACFRTNAETELEEVVSFTDSYYANEPVYHYWCQDTEACETYQQQRAQEVER